MDLAQGRTCSNVMSDIGAIELGWWHSWHFCWKIGATFLENVTGCEAVSAAETTVRVAAAVPSAASPVRAMKNPNPGNR
jgi:hypothetical protein